MYLHQCGLSDGSFAVLGIESYPLLLVVIMVDPFAEPPYLTVNHQPAMLNYTGGL